MKINFKPLFFLTLLAAFSSVSFAERIETGNSQMLQAWAENFLTKGYKNNAGAMTRGLTTQDLKCELTVQKITESKEKAGFKIELKFGATYVKTASVYLGSIDPHLDNVHVTIHDVSYNPVRPETLTLTNLAIIGSMGVGETLQQVEDYVAIRINEQGEVVSATAKNFWNTSPDCKF